MRSKSIILVLIMMLSIATISFADEDIIEGSIDPKINVNKINNQLLQFGFTKEQIDKLKYETKETILSIENPGKVLSFEESYLRRNSSGELIRTQSLDESELRLLITAIEIPDIEGYKAVKLVAQYEWLISPVYALTDNLGISWSPGWLAYRYELDNYYTIPITGGTAHNEGNAYVEDLTSGIVFEFDFHGYKGEHGNAYVDIIADNMDIIKQSSHSAARVIYGHDLYVPNLSIGIDISPTPGVSAGFSVEGTSEYLDKPTSWENSEILD
ncbi:hypothetical protein [Sporosalibacterium faouarense]|uniref:hypothetical protein n=1 Tax=Sporosalibacterium faouarense TaxID=516123 RepID=UPI00141CE0E7|nr:hypothetical protein [Sporosalibacterium faouarense]MTI47354.1 hypothetical protein [Bacillota bacterium]